MSDDSDGVLTVDVLDLDIVIIMFIVATESGIKLPQSHLYRYRNRLNKLHIPLFLSY